MCQATQGPYNVIIHPFCKKDMWFWILNYTNYNDSCENEFITFSLLQNENTFLFYACITFINFHGHLSANFEFDFQPRYSHLFCANPKSVSAPMHAIQKPIRVILSICLNPCVDLKFNPNEKEVNSKHPYSLL